VCSVDQKYQESGEGKVRKGRKGRLGEGGIE